MMINVIRLKGTLNFPFFCSEKPHDEVNEQSCRPGQHREQQAGNEENMADLQLSRIVCLPGADEQAEDIISES